MHATVEFVGYIGRIQGHFDQWALGPFIQQSLLLLVAPALFAASIYIILGRVILLTDGERYSLIRQRWLTKIFVAGDVLSFMVQGAGGGIQGSGSEKSMKLGEKLILVGLFLQLFFFGFFVVVAGIFHFRLVRSKTDLSRVSSVNIKVLPWKRHLIALYVASGLILVRSIFRVIEYLQGNAGYLLRHEIFLYIFDAVLMLAVMLIFNWIHPSQVTELYQQRLSEYTESEVEMHPQRGQEGGAWA